MDSYIDAWEGVMRGYRIRLSWLPMLLAAGLTACASNGVQPGIVYTSSAPPAASGPGYPANGPVQANGPAQGSNAYPAPGVVGEAGRVVSIREVGLAGSGGGGGGGNGALGGGLLGGGGATTASRAPWRSATTATSNWATESKSCRTVKGSRRLCVTTRAVRTD